nr:hypothetical protein [Tanacetum cinerariifolium]
MADIAFTPQHNMFSYLEKTGGNVVFHQIVDFFTSSSIHHALTIHSTIDGKTIVIRESLVRRDLLFTDDNGIICLTNAQIFENLPLMRSEGKPIQSSNPPLSTGNTVRSGKDKMEHAIKLMYHVSQHPMIHLSQEVTHLERRKNLKSQKKVQDIDDLVDEEVIFEDNGRGEKGGSIAETVSTARPDISASRPEVSTAEPKTPPIATTLFDDEDVTIDDTLKLYTKEQNWIDAFVPIGFKEDEKRVRSRKKRVAGSSSKQKSSKKQKVNDQESVDSDKELNICLKVVPDDDKAINYETLDVKSLIVDCESQKLGTMQAGDVRVYKLSRLDASYRHFLTFSRMLEVFDRQDVLDLHKIVMERFSANDLEVRTIIREEFKTQLHKILPKAVSAFATLVIERNVTKSLEAAVLTRSFSQPKSTYEAAASLSEYELTKILLDKMEENKSHLRDDYKKKLYNELVDDKDQDPSAGSDRWKKRRKSRKEAESSKDVRSKEEKSSSTSKDASQSQHKSFGKSAHAEDPSQVVDDSRDFLINNDLEYLKGGDLSGRYSTSVTKTKAATYEIKWIEDLVCNLVAANMSSSKDVYSRKRIIAFTRLTIMKKYDYGHLQEIEVRQEDRMLYKFREGNKDGISTKEEIERFRQTRARVMIQDINKQLYERWLMQNLEKFVCGREYGNDLRLLERII